MKKIETLLKLDLGQKFDTPKKLNRSEKNIPSEILEKLEAGEFTCEMIAELSKQFPIFRYRTCITIHGNWGEVGKRRLGGYTNIIQNGNGSTEVKYSAIDIKKIETIRGLLRSVKADFFFHSNSSERYFYKSVNTRDAEQYNKVVSEMKPIAERVKGANIYGYLNLYAASSLYGGVDVILQINPLSIPAGEEIPFCYLLTGLNKETWQLRLAEIAEQERLDKIESERREQEREAEKERERIAAEPIFEQGREVLRQAGYVKEEKTLIEQGKIYVKLSVTDGKPIYTAYKYSKTKAQKKWRANECRSENLTFEFKEYGTRETMLTTNSGYVLPVVTKQPEKIQKTETKTEKQDGVKVIDYSERAVAIYGNTKPIKDELKAIGARFNPFLTIDGVKQAGWVLPITQRQKLNFINN